MPTLAYPAKVARGEDDRFVVRFRDLPGAVTDGASFTEAMDEAEDLLLSHCVITMRRKENLPEPGTPKRDEVLISVPLSIAPKLALYQLVRKKGIKVADLANRLDVTETVVRRMLDPDHDTKPEKMRDALRALGMRLQVAIEPVGGIRERKPRREATHSDRKLTTAGV